MSTGGEGFAPGARVVSTDLALANGVFKSPKSGTVLGISKLSGYTGLLRVRVDGRKAVGRYHRDFWQLETASVSTEQEKPAGAQGETRADVGMLTLPTFTTIQELAALIGNVLSVMGYNLSGSEDHRLAKVIAESYCPGGWLLRVAALEAEREAFYMDYRIKCDRETKAQSEEIARLRAEVEYQMKEARRMRLGWDRSHDAVKAERAQRIAAERVKLDAESQVQALQAQLDGMVAPEERDQWKREAQRLAVERAYVQGVFIDAGVEVGPDLGEAARAIADLLSEAQRRVDALTDEMQHLVQSVSSRHHWSQTGGSILVVPDETYRRARAFIKAVAP